MNYTKGKWEYDPSKYLIYANRPHPIHTVVREYIAKCEGGHIDFRKANALRICQCVNNFDTLLAASKKYYEVTQNVDRYRFPDGVCEARKIELAEAIAAAEKEG